MKNFETKMFVPVFDNQLDPFVPEIWAMESLMVLYRNVVAVNLVHRDFEDEIAEFGDIVNTRRPAKFATSRKTDADEVTNQDAIATNVAVPLDQHHHVSFIIKDGQESKGMKNLVVTFLEPALQAIAQGMEEVVLGERYNFLSTTAGSLGTAPTIPDITELDEVMTDNLCPLTERQCITSSATKADLISIDTFHEADKVGDQGTALREGSLGRKLGFNWFMSQNAKAVTASDSRSGTTSAAEPAGETSIAITGITGAITNGSWVTVAGEPQLVTGSTGGATPTAITVSPGLKNAAANGAAVTVYTPVLVNNSGGYAQGWVKTIAVDGATLSPRAGQLASVGNTSLAAATKYGIITTDDSPTTTGISLNRGLEAAIADNGVIGLGPAGSFNWAFHKNAVALVTRPLALPMTGSGARGFVQQMDGLSVRVVISYDSKAQGHRVTVDLLAGVKTLDENLGALLLG